MQIEQIDRDAAADWIERTATDTWGLPDGIRAGKCDHYPTVQAFARHRLAALSARPDSDMVERVAFAIRAHGDSSYDTEHYMDAARAAIAAITGEGA